MIILKRPSMFIVKNSLSHFYQYSEHVLQRTSCTNKERTCDNEAITLLSSSLAGISFRHDLQFHALPTQPNHVAHFVTLTI